jgi:CubicO group peptidase (beta-lactamase class C family)
MDPYQHYDRPIFFQYLQNAKIGEKKYLYSNVGYGILTQILEHVTGYSYRDMIERYIAQPLNTPDILGGWGQTTAGRSAKKYSAILKEKPVWSTLNALAGSGDIKISLRALKKWMYYQVNPDRAPYPLNESIKLTQMAQHHDPAGFNIGLAWFQDIFNNILYYNHNGSTEGFTIELLYDLNHKRALIYVSNTDTYYPGLCLTDMFTGEGCDPVWTSMPKSISAYLGWYEIGDGDHREPNSPMEIYESPFAPIFVVEVEDAPPYRLLYNYEDKVFYTENDRFTIEFDSYTGGTIIESTREGDFKYDFVRQYKIAKRSESRKIPY